jgi:hypothetical protein
MIKDELSTLSSALLDHLKELFDEQKIHKHCSNVSPCDYEYEDPQRSNCNFSKDAFE